MDAAELLRAVRRRWTTVAAVVAVAVVAGWLTTTVAPPGPPLRTYRATSVLLSSATDIYGTGTDNLRTVAALATVGEVPNRVAQTIQYSGDPRELARKIRSTGNPETGILKIVATSRDPNEAKLLADTFAQELYSFMNERTTLTSSREAESLGRRIDRLEQEVEALNRQIGSDTEGDELEVAQRDAKIRQYGLLYERYQQLAAENAQPSSLQIIQDAQPVPVAEGGFFQVRSGSSRLILAAFLGLVAGVALVFVRERFDTRIRTKEAAEQHFDLPVLAEIPFVRGWRRRSNIAVTSDPKSAAADAFRLLAAGIMRRPPTPPQTILVTGPGPGEGKSTVVANLAAAFAEVGKKVLIVSCDLHRPTVHTLFGVPNTRGLTDALRSGRDGHAIINGKRWRTSLSNVRLVPSGMVPDKPGELLSSPLMRQVLAEGREVADVVIIDTAPILASSDATHLFPLVDAVVVVGRAGRTTAQSAQRTSELLLRLGAPVVGAALNGATEGEHLRGYYHYYSDGSRRGRKRHVGSMIGLSDRE
jgi:capsular exopolysaccharide synthesis family protein